MGVTTGLSAIYTLLSENAVAHDRDHAVRTTLSGRNEFTMSLVLMIFDWRAKACTIDFNIVNTWYVLQYMLKDCTLLAMS